MLTFRKSESLQNNHNIFKYVGRGKLVGCGTTNVGYGTNSADAGVGIGVIKKGIQNI